MAGSSSGSQGSRKRPSSSLAPATKKSTASKKTVQKWKKAEGDLRQKLIYKTLSLMWFVYNIYT